MIETEDRIDGVFLDQYAAGWLNAALESRAEWPATAAELTGQSPVVLGAKRQLLPPSTLRFVFLALTLFSLVGLAGEAIQVVEDGSFDGSSLLILVFAALVTWAMLTQLRGLAMMTRLGRRLAYLSPKPQPEPPRYLVLLFQTVGGLPSEALGAATSAGLFAVATRKGARFVPLLAVLVGGVAVVALVARLLFAAIDSSSISSTLAIGIAFAGLSLYAYVQFVRTMQRSGWRSSLMTIARRTLYDCNRIYAGAHSFAHLGVAGAGTALVVTAGLGPIVFPAAPPFAIFGFDAVAGQVYRVNPADGLLTRLGPPVVGSLAPFTAIPHTVALPDGTKVKSSALLTVLTNQQGQFVGTIDPRSGEQRSLGKLPKQIDVAAVGIDPSSAILLLDRSGELFRLDAERVFTSLGRGDHRIDAATFDAPAKRFIALSGGDLISISTTTGAASSTGDLQRLSGAKPCGLARIGTRIVVADAASRSLLVFDSQRNAVGTIGPSPLAATICGIVATRAK